MKKGAFLEKNRKKVTKEVPEKRGTTKKRKRRRQQRRMLMTGIGIIAGLLVAAFALMLFMTKDSPLVGQWSLDGVTSYAFYKDGKGALMLPTAEYAFTYKVEENVLYLDYADEKAKDAQYVYEIKGDKLILTGGNTTTQGELVCTKSE